MKVLIVAKTRHGSGACIGGITLDEGRSVRLIAADAAFNEHVGLEYHVGEVWEMDATPAEHVIPPHVENIIVRSKCRLAAMSAPERFVEAHMPPVTGGANLLYAGLTQAARTGALYIAERTGIPPFSTTFWCPDQPLQMTDDSKRIRYRYPTPDGGRTLTFVGFQEPIGTIPAGALVRVSLAHWWRPEDDHSGELRCYVQLSGWFLNTRNSAFSASPTPRITAERAEGAEKNGASIFSASSASSAVKLSSARDLLRSVFGYDDFRPYQADIIANILARRDTLAVMPTGSGKSVC